MGLLAVFATLIITFSLLEINAQKNQLRADKIEEFHSNILKESRRLLVNLPKDYHSKLDKSYPVLFALDATSHDQHVLNAKNVLCSAGLLTDVIVVGIVNEDRKTDLTPNYIMKDDDPTKLGHGDVFLEFLEKEAIPLIEKNYRTTKYRMISGNSRSGLFAFFAMLEKPYLFEAYFCYSPAFWRNGNLIVKKAEAFFDQNKQLDKFLYLSLGSDENEKMKSGFDSMVNAIKKKDPVGMSMFFNYTENADHGSNAYYSIPRALKIWNDKL